MNNLLDNLIDTVRQIESLTKAQKSVKNSKYFELLTKLEEIKKNILMQNEVEKILVSIILNRRDGDTPLDGDEVDAMCQDFSLDKYKDWINKHEGNI